MKDSYTNWREFSDGNLTATETSPAIELGAAPIVGHDIEITIPAYNAVGDTLDITFTQSATFGGSYATFQTLAQITGTLVAAGPNGSLVKKFKLANTLPFVKCVLTVGGVTPNFGKVTAGVDVGVRQNVLTIGD